MLEPFAYVHFVLSLFTILTPFAAIPVFLTLTEGQGGRAKDRTARAAVATVALALLAAAFSGEYVLSALGTSLPSFRVGGGIVLLLMALSMLAAQVSPVQQRPEETQAAAADQRQTAGVVPLGIPLLAGPGAISRVIIEMQRSPSWGHAAAVIGAILAVCAVLYVALRLATPIGRRLGTTGINIVNRLFGLLLAAIAVEMMANGLKALFPALVG